MTADHDISVFAKKPWLALGWADIAPTKGVPTMLSPKERKLYMWLAEHWATGAGEIVDLGCFVGGSTALLAEGQRRAGRASTIHAYDRFRANDAIKKSMLYPAGIPPFESESILALSKRLLAPWAPAVVFHQGAIEDKIWTGGPIEILTLDASKTTASMDRMAELFFPSLIPGRSIIVQQDFLHWKQPWIAVQMERFADWFEPIIQVPQATMVYLCTRPVDAAAVKAGRCNHLTDDELIAGLDAAIHRFSGLQMVARLQEMKDAIALNPGAREARLFRRRPDPPETT